MCQTFDVIDDKVEPNRAYSIVHGTLHWSRKFVSRPNLASKILELK